MDHYTQLARSTIEEYVKNGKTLLVPHDLVGEMLKKRAGVFVSIHKKIPRSSQISSRINPNKEGELRGCIGTFLPTKKNIAQEIIDNAISACSADYRFPPIKNNELKNLEISVDVLTEPQPIDGISSLEPKKYGVIVRSEDSRTGLLLPNLPGVDSPEYQIAICRQKAGIAANEPVYLYRFEVERHS